MKFKTVTSILGMTAPVLYLLAVVSGPIFWTEYRSMRDTVSLLASDGSPMRGLISFLFVTHNVLLLLFGFGWRFVQRKETRKGNLAAILISVFGFLGIVMIYFPQDGMGSHLTFIGVMHIVLAGVMSLITILAMFFRGLAEWRVHGQKKMSVYSFTSLFFAFTTGVLTTINIAGQWEAGGLLERLTIGGFLQWVFVEALMLYRRKI